MRKNRLFIGIISAVILSVCSMISFDLKVKTAFAEGYTEGKAECVVELNSRRILYANNAEKPLPMASTTKIATAITVLDECKDIKKNHEIPKQAVGIEGSSVYLKEKDIYSVEDLLYGLMLRSGNDCATALALFCGGSIDGFSVKMNKTAQKAGAFSTNFANPHGLPCKNHYTTAKDLSYITCYALQNPIFKQIVATKYYEPRNWKNKNKLLSLYDGAIGVKTGYTKEAGRCLVSAAERNDMTLICTLLNCPTTYERTQKLFDDAFSAYKRELLAGKEQVFEVNGEQAVLKKDLYYPILEEEREFIEIKTIPLSGKSKNIVGHLEIYLAKRLLFSENLYKL